MLWYRDLIGCGTENANINIEHPAIVSLIPLCIEKVVLLRITGLDIFNFQFYLYI